MSQPRMKTTGELEGAIAACRELLVWALIFGAAVNLLYLAPSIYMLQVYDRVLQTGGLVTLGLVSVMLAFALATLATLDSLRTRLMGRASLRLERLLAPRLLEAGLSRQTGPAAAQHRQALRLFDTFRQTFSGPGATAIMDAPWAPIYICVCFMIHPVIGMITLAGGAVLIALAIRNERVLRARIAQAGELAPRVYAGQEAETAVGEAARAMGMRRVLIERQLERRAELNALQAGAMFDSTKYTSLTKFVRMALQSTALGVGAYLAVQREISPGALIAGSILASRALAPLEQIVQAWRPLGEARNGYNAIRAVLAAEPPKVERTALPAPSGALRFESVSARISADRLALQNASFSLAPGEILGVIGPSGAGKSTLARLAAGGTVPDAGVVRLDGANRLDWDTDVLGRHIGYLPQELALIAGTIAENIRRFEPRDDANAAEIDAAVVAAAQAAGAHDMVVRFQKGYDTELGVGGSGLSLGQTQRVALARALYRGPALVVLDEPNAHLDQDGEMQLLDALKQLRARGAAVLVVAHRARVLEIADRLMVLRDGRIDTIGPRSEVMSRLARGPGAPRLAVAREGQ